MKNKIDIPVDLNNQEIDELIEKLKVMKSPKFKVGDWVVYNHKVYVIKQVDNYMTVTLFNEFSGTKIGTKGLLRLATGEEIEKAIKEKGKGYFVVTKTNTILKLDKVDVVGYTPVVNLYHKDLDYYMLEDCRLPTIKELESLKPKLPASWEEYIAKHGFDEQFRHDGWLYDTKIEIFHQLLILRDEYRDDWKPDYNTDDWKYGFLNSELGIIDYNDIASPVCFSFQTEKLRDLFFKNFKSELEQIKEFL